MLKRTAFAEQVGIRYPLVQGPFGGGLSTVELASTVSNLGGLGSYGAHNLTPEALLTTVKELKRATANPFAMNLWISDHDPGGIDISVEDFERYAKKFTAIFREFDLPMPPQPTEFSPRYSQLIEALIEARPPVFSFVYGIPEQKILDACKSKNILTIGAATSIAEAQALEIAGVDALVATGFEAGGHRPSFLARSEDSLFGTFALTQLVASRVKIPVIAAGGVADRRGIDAAMTLGADAVQMGTAFLACNESGATDEHRQLLFSDHAQQTKLTRSFTGRLARGIPNRWMDELMSNTANIAPFPIQGWFMSKLKAAAIKAKRTDVVSLWSGQIAPQLKYHSARELFASLID